MLRIRWRPRRRLRGKMRAWRSARRMRAIRAISVERRRSTRDVDIAVVAVAVRADDENELAQAARL